ncbi:MAG: hypothetical protein HC834_02390 [Rhodospirillales bacterium]|nr:hypothetical protein [Rhodospirillales bacterium]
MDESALINLLRSPSVLATLTSIVEDAVRRVVVEQAESLVPLSAILDISPDAARMRINRDPELAAIGVRVGRRHLFRRSDVIAYMRRRGFSVVGGQ